MDKHVNLAGLPKSVALMRARAGGRAIFGDEEAVSKAYEELMRHWFDKNMPRAVGQSDDEFDDLADEVGKEFEAGVDEAIKTARDYSYAIPNPFEGEAAADDALKVIRALNWLRNNTTVDTAPEDIAIYQTLVRVGLAALEREVAMARHALSACRSEIEEKFAANKKQRKD